MIELKHVYKTYGGDRHALRDINFKIDTGDFVYLMGPSGAGKTTLFKLISAYEKISSGDISILKYNLNGLKESQIPFFRRKIGFVFQNFKLIKNKTVYENIVLPLMILETPQSEQNKRVQELLERLNLSHLQDQYPDYLSGGEQQRVAIARALIHEPPLIIADEPTGNLDADLSRVIMNLFYDFSQQGTTFLVATHDDRLIQKKEKHRLIRLEKGNLVEDRLT